MIVVDSREKKWSHIKEYFDKNNIDYVFPQKLNTGDYINTEYPNIVIDRKANLEEICSNLAKGKGNIIRFTHECQRAKAENVRFIVLIEGTNFTSVKDLADWKSKYSKYTGKWLANQMFNLTVAYNVEWKFCKKSQTPKLILELLNYDK